MAQMHRQLESISSSVNFSSSAKSRLRSGLNTMDDPLAALIEGIASARILLQEILPNVLSVWW